MDDAVIAMAGIELRNFRSVKLDYNNSDLSVATSEEAHEFSLSIYSKVDQLIYQPFQEFECDYLWKTLFLLFKLDEHFKGISTFCCG